jgi:hypothetical protein
MRKWITLTLLISFIFLLILYSGNKIPIENNGINNQTLNQNLNNIDNNSSRNVDEEEEYNPALELLYNGSMDGIEFGIGTNSIDIIEEWGEPNQKVNFMGGLLLVYDDIYFFTDGFILNKEITYGKVTEIYYTGEESIYGIQIGTALEQVKETLGSPNNTYISHYSELYIDDNLIVNYRAGEYEANFEIDDESEMVHSVSIWKVEK